MRIIEWDAPCSLPKFNPLINWTYPQVLSYIQAQGVPDNPLHHKGFISIGCAPAAGGGNCQQDLRSVC